MDKTLGQIAHEQSQKSSRWICEWGDLPQESRDAWEAIASAVAAAVKEEDARICDCYAVDDCGKNDDAKRCAAAIRASIKEVK